MKLRIYSFKQESKVPQFDQDVCSLDDSGRYAQDAFEQEDETELRLKERQNLPMTKAQFLEAQRQQTKHYESMNKDNTKTEKKGSMITELSKGLRKTSNHQSSKALDKSSSSSSRLTPSSALGKRQPIKTLINGLISDSSKTNIHKSMTNKGETTPQNSTAESLNKNILQQAKTFASK